jgi:hypothetical protein
MPPTPAGIEGNPGSSEPDTEGEGFEPSCGFPRTAFEAGPLGHLRHPSSRMSGKPVIGADDQHFDTDPGDLFFRPPWRHIQSGRPDSNRGPLRPERSALPD